jgi:UDP-N-acetyl-D-mannosaminuronic acid dehydrogenase
MGSDQKICVIGLGKAGLPLACTIADSGLDVVGLDVNKEYVDRISRMENPIPEEPGVQEILDKCIGNNFTVMSDSDSVDLVECRVHIVIVPLFIDEETKQCDFSILERAFSGLARRVKKGDLVVLETTVPPKTTETFVKKLLEDGSGLVAGVDFSLAYSPERIMTGYSISRYKEFPKVVGGLTEGCGNRAFDVYSKFCNKVERVKDCRTAELVKVAEGVYRDVNIGLANELYVAAEKLGVDYWQVRDKANHAFCNLHEPGIVGGHCIPVYSWFLINNPELDMGVVKTARLLSDSMAKYYAEKVDKIISSSGNEIDKNSIKVAVIGLSYREGVKEKAYSGSFLMIKALKQKGYEVYGLDPYYNLDEVKSVFGVEPVALNGIAEMDAIVLLNKLDEYKEELMVVKDKVVDAKNILVDKVSIGEVKND